MKTEKGLKNIALYFIPLALELIIHFAASGGFMPHENDIFLLRVYMAAVMTGFSMLMGEGYGAIAFIVAGCVDHVIAYIFVVILSVVGIGSNLAGYMIAGIEGGQCLWMTLVFWCIDIFLIIFSIIRIVQLLKEKQDG